MTPRDTRTNILDAAERLFAEKGFDGTAIREIIRAANVNVAAVHYHYGSKEEVLRGVTDRIVGPLNERRFVLLDEATTASAPDAPPVEAVLEAFIRPDFETLLALSPSAARFLGRTYSDQTPWIREMAAEQFGAAGERFLPAFATALPHLDFEEIFWRLRQIVVLLVDAFATWPEEGMSQSEADQRLHQLVGFAIPALEAPRGVTAAT